MKRSRTRRSEEDIAELYEDQLQFLKASAAQYDRGQLTSYRRMAIALRVLFHDKGISRSLVTQMNLRDRRYLTCSRPPRPDNQMGDCDLIALLVPAAEGKRAVWVAGLDNWSMEFIAFQDWWAAPVLNDGHGIVFSRSDLVLHIADQDGGAHVDPEIDTAFELMRKERFRWASGRHVTEHPDRAAIRTIAHEAIKSLDPTYKRKPAFKSEPHAYFRSLYFGSSDAPERQEIVSYHLTNPSEPCPCLSGRSFGDCHARGAQGPLSPQIIGGTHVAPPGAAYARIGLRVSPNSN